MAKMDIKRSDPFQRPTLTGLTEDILPDRVHRSNLRVTRVGLEGEAYSLEEWAAFGQTLREIEGGLQWAIGDWINQGQHRWGSKYAGVVEQLGFDETTLRTYVYVATNVQMSLRNDNLSWSHHKAIAHLYVEDQDYWLGLAAQHRWSVVELRRRIAGQPDRDPASLLDKTLNYTQRLELKAAKMTRGQRLELADEFERMAGRLRLMDGK